MSEVQTKWFQNISIRNKVFFRKKTSDYKSKCLNSTIKWWRFDKSTGSKMEPVKTDHCVSIYSLKENQSLFVKHHPMGHQLSKT